ncbi:efflux transporter outer membrane subunit [Paracoccus litorisediminis]|uniref:efflux transporter outer membrane subunit n=1 Tax=Paracoccus litorisediminis TaxID=2006130 RepID=UPI003730E2E6
MKMSITLSRRFLLGGLVANVVLASCAPGMRPQATMDLTQRFWSGSPARMAGSNPWWAAFRDPFMDDLIADGLARNLNVLSAIAAIRESEANARMVGASDLPQAQLSGEASRRLNGTISELSSASFGASWLIDVFGANHAAQNGAEAELDAAWHSADVARLTVASAIASAYIDLRYYQEALALTRQSLESRERSLAMTRDQSAVGMVSRVEVLQAEQLVTQAEAGLPALEVGVEQSINRLATLTAAPDDTLSSRLRRRAHQPRAAFKASVGVPADVIRARPDIGVAEMRLAAAVAAVGEAEAAFYPKLTLSGSITPMKLAGGSMKTWGFGPQLSVPLFSGGLNRARLSAAEARAEQARLSWQSSVQKSVEEVENALAAYNRDGRAVAAQTKLVANATESVGLARNSYELGQSGFFAVLDAERTLLSARETKANAVRRQALNFVALSVAAAGGVGVRD